MLIKENELTPIVAGGEYNPNFWRAAKVGAASGAAAGFVAGVGVDPAMGAGFIMVGGRWRTICSAALGGAGGAVE